MSARVMWFVTERQAEVLYSIPSEVIASIRERRGESHPPLAKEDAAQLSALIRKGLVHVSSHNSVLMRTALGQALAEHLAGVEA